MAELKLGKLPDRTPVKLTISLTPDLAERLAAYQALYLKTYEREETIGELATAMLAAFLDADRAFVAAWKASGKA
jgi:hypothetical protein